MLLSLCMCTCICIRMCVCYEISVIVFMTGHINELTVVCIICWHARKLFIHTVLHLSCLTTVLFEQFPQPVHNVAIEHTVWETQ